MCKSCAITDICEINLRQLNGDICADCAITDICEINLVPLQKFIQLLCNYRNEHNFWNRK